MRAALIVAAHHLRRVVVNPGLVVLLLAIPVTLAVIEYAAFGRTAAVGTLPPTRVLFLDEDDTLVSGAVPQVFAGGPVKDMFELAQVADRDEALSLFKRGQAAALVVVPRGFQASVLAGSRAELVFYPNPTQTIGPEIARRVLEMTTIIGNGLHAQAAAPIARVKEWVDQDREPTAEEVAGVSRGFFEAGQRLQGLQGLGKLTVAVQRPGQEARTGFGTNPSQFFAYVFPGLVIFALLFIGQSLAFRLLRDRLRGLQRRITMAPVSPLALAGGSIIFMTVALLGLLVLLAAIGAVVFRIHLRDPLALLALALGFTAFAAGLHLLSIALARSDRSASFVSSVVVLVLSLLGGTFVPAEQYPPFLRGLAMLLPNGAAQQGFVDVLVHRVPWSALGGRLLVVWIWGLALLALSTITETRRTRVTPP